MLAPVELAAYLFIPFATVRDLNWWTDINNVAPLIKDNPSLQGYFNSLKSRIGYRLILGGTRHYSYYLAETKWPFPITKALRAMEDHLFNSLNLSAGAIVLDAGCGAGHVAIYMAKKGLRVFGIDVMDYYYLDGLQDDLIDIVYTIKALIHFYRVLKLGGSVALYKYNYVKFRVLPRMLEDIGFENVEVKDLSHNIEPMLRLFFTIAYLPFLLIRLFGLKKWFINTVLGVEAYRGRKFWRYIVITCTKPDDAVRRGGPDVLEVVKENKNT
ncbi:S-adenosyl-L-methionine-dependent methyltransferase [Cenococcum geophilum]